MKTTILQFIDMLSLYDYLLFGGVLFFFFFFIILAIALHDKLMLAITFVLASFLILVTSPLQYMVLHKYLYHHTLNLTTVQDLEFTDALLIRGDLNNTSNQTFRECILYVSIAKTSPIQLLNKAYPYLPFKTQKLSIKEAIKPKESYSFKLLIEPFNYPHPFQVTARGHCK